MCGIAGWMGQIHDASAIAEQVAGRLRMRGPDQYAARHFEGAALIHTRLSIIDLSPTGAQPMADPEGRVWVVFNGEIYNHHELRKDLEAKGHRFRGRSDTEVLPALYLEYGPRFVERLRGMFAFALYLPREKKMLLARDRFGIKPLFYATAPNLFAFASEVNALTDIPGWDRTVDRQAVFDFAALLFVPAPATFYKSARVLEPGACLEVSFGEGGVDVVHRRFHNWSIAVDDGLTLERAADLVEKKLDRAVRSQLESDVPLGSLLSGGIDSSLVSAAASGAGGMRLQTFNVKFPDVDYDETWAAEEVARLIDSQHETLDIGAIRGSWEDVTALLRYAGQPFADTSLFAVNAICRQMRKRVKVALSGDGGDEAYGGYRSFWQLTPIAAFQSFPAPARAMASALASAGGRIGVGPRALPDRLDGLRDADAGQTTATLLNWVREDEHARLCVDADQLPVLRHFEAQWPHDLPRRASRVERLSAHLTEVWTRLILPNDFLFKVDAASMRESLEVRVPMLDEDLFSFGLTLPHRLKARGRTPKIVTRTVAERRLGKAIAWKEKLGFSMPVDRWVDDQFRPQLHEALLGSSSRLPEFFDPVVYRPIVEAFCAQTALPDISRHGLYQRAIMLLAVHLALQGAPANAN